MRLYLDITKVEIWPLHSLDYQEKGNPPKEQYGVMLALSNPSILAKPTSLLTIPQVFAIRNSWNTGLWNSALYSPKKLT